MAELRNVTVVIPSLDPDQRLPEIIQGVREKGFTDILLIDDGSSAENQHYFDEAEQSGCTVLHHPQNRGKGRALKTAFEWLLENRPDAAGCVTIDGDGQHHAEDIRACTELMLQQKQDALILGARDFNSGNVPPKSKFGNKCTSIVFRLFGLRISDTQTGLRVFPRSIWKQMTEIAGERFEYETNMLLECRQRNIPMIEHTIRTIYIDANATTHFHPIKDSLRVYGIIFRFFPGSFVSFLLDFLLFNVCNISFGRAGFAQHLFLAAAIARMASAGYNLLFHRKSLFRGEKPSAVTAGRYCILWALQLLASFGLTALLSMPFGDSLAAQAVFKLIADVFLYFISIRVQQMWVFRRIPAEQE